VWWIVFVAVDVYIGLVILDLLARSAPPVVLAFAFVARIWF